MKLVLLVLACASLAFAQGSKLPTPAILLQPSAGGTSLFTPQADVGGNLGTNLIRWNTIESRTYNARALSGAVKVTQLTGNGISGTDVLGDPRFSISTVAGSAEFTLSVGIHDGNLAGNSVTLFAPSGLAASYALTYPATLPATTKFLQVDNTGAMSFASSTLTVCGSNKQVIYNDSAACGADANFTWDKATKFLNVAGPGRLGINSASPGTYLDVRGSGGVGGTTIITEESGGFGYSGVTYKDSAAADKAIVGWSNTFAARSPGSFLLYTPGSDPINFSIGTTVQATISTTGLLATVVSTPSLLADQGLVGDGGLAVRTVVTPSFQSFVAINLNTTDGTAIYGENRHGALPVMELLSGSTSAGAVINLRSTGTGDLIQASGVTVLDKALNLTVTSCTGCGGAPPFSDATPLLKYSADPTRLLQFSLLHLTTATTRVWSVQDADMTPAGLNLTQSWTGYQTLTGSGFDVGAVRNTTVSLYSALEYQNNAGTQKALIGWANASASVGPNSLLLNTANEPITFYIGSTLQGRFDNSGGYVPTLTADGATIAENGLVVRIASTSAATNISSVNVNGTSGTAYYGEVRNGSLPVMELLSNTGSSGAVLNLRSLGTGDLIQKSGVTVLDKNLNLTVASCTGCGTASSPFTDAIAILFNAADPTKLLKLALGGFTTATTRTLTPQNASYTIAAVDLNNAFSAVQSFAPSTPNTSVNITNSDATGLAGIRVSNSTTGQIGFYGVANASSGKTYASKPAFGSVTNHAVDLIVNDTMVWEIDTSGNLAPSTNVSVFLGSSTKNLSTVYTQVLESDTSTGLLIESLSSGDIKFFTTASATQRWAIKNTTGDFVPSVTNTSAVGTTSLRMSNVATVNLDSSGTALFGLIGSSLSPSSNVTFSLGTGTSNRYLKLWSQDANISGAVDLSGNINFNTDNTSTIGSSTVRSGDIESTRLITRISSGSTRRVFMNGTGIGFIDAGGTQTLFLGTTSGVIQVNGNVGLSVTKTVRDSSGLGTCTLIYDSGVLTGGTC